MNSKPYAKRYGHGTHLKTKSYFSPSYIDHCSDTFGYMFPEVAQNPNNTLACTEENRTLLIELGDALGEKSDDPSTDSVIPAGYTYLGQFIDHDITLDPFSTLDCGQDPHKTQNFRTPALDLDAIYGRGPAVDPFLYDHDPNLGIGAGIKLLLGTNRPTGPGGPRGLNGIPGIPTNSDLPRTSDFTAIIGDPRNNENLLVSQLHHAMLKFHNAVVDHLIMKGQTGDDLFEKAREIVTHHYQWVVIYDFLRRIVGDAVINLVKNGHQRFFKVDKIFMPVEFSVAAYRFGHSMIRTDYHINDGDFNPATLIELFEFVRVPRLPVFSNWVVDFNRLFETGRELPINYAKKIDTHLSKQLESLPGADPTDRIMRTLAIRNLLRGLAFGVPTGQSVAEYMGGVPLTESMIKENATPKELEILNTCGGRLLKKTPLWYYVLKEAELTGGNSLGQVGARIITEVFIALLETDKRSFLNRKGGFTPHLPRINGKAAGDYDMADILHFSGVLRPERVMASMSL